MPLTKLDFKPGINKEGTSYSNEGGYYNCEKVRFRSGYAEKIGGWRNQDPTYSFIYKGVARAMWNWVTYDSANLLALGTSQKYYIEQGAQFHDITPVRQTVTYPAVPALITTVAGSKVVVVNATGHGATVNSFINIQGNNTDISTEASDLLTTEASDLLTTEGITVGGAGINGEYEIISVINANNYTIALPVAATTNGTSGVDITVTYQINAGTSAATTGLGWGTMPWSSGGWGAAATTNTVAIPLRLWSQDIFEEDLIFAERAAQIYYWQKNTATFPAAVTLQSYIATSTTKYTAVTTAASALGTSIIYVDSSDGIDLGAVVTGTGITATPPTYVTNIGGIYGLDITLSQSVSGVASGATLNFTYSSLHAPNQTNYLIASDTSHFLIVLGAKPYSALNYYDDTTFDPMLVRWSELDNPYEWVPRPNNQSGEQHLSNGSFLIAAQNTRNEILLWSDVALFSMQYVGPPYVWNFVLIGDNTSIISPNAAIAVNTVTYWMGVDKFYIYDGRLQTLNCTLWKFVYDNVNKEQRDQIICGSNEGYSEVWWFYPSTNSKINDSYVIYNYLEQTWYYGTMNRSAWLDSPLRQYPMATFSAQNSYLNADISATATTINLVDTTTYPTAGSVIIDSEYISYTNNDPVANTLSNCTRGVAGTVAASHLKYTPSNYLVNNQVMFHETGTDDYSVADGLPIESYLESSDFDIGDGHNFGFIWRVIPDLTFRGSNDTTVPQVMLSIKSRLNSGSAYTTAFTDPTNVTRTSTVPVEQYTGQVYTRTRGRQAAFRIDSTRLGTAWQVGAMRIDVRQDGRR